MATWKNSNYGVELCTQAAEYPTMERSRVAKRFRELGWDPVLPDPQDDRHAREVKTQNLRQALQVRILSLKSYLHYHALYHTLIHT